MILACGFWLSPLENPTRVTLLVTVELLFITVVPNDSQQRSQKKYTKLGNKPYIWKAWNLKKVSQTNADKKEMLLLSFTEEDFEQ